jgi:hypothetical protein
MIHNPFVLYVGAKGKRLQDLLLILPAYPTMTNFKAGYSLL